MTFEEFNKLSDEEVVKMLGMSLEDAEKIGQKMCDKEILNIHEGLDIVAAEVQFNPQVKDIIKFAQGLILCFHSDIVLDETDKTNQFRREMMNAMVDITNKYKDVFVEKVQKARINKANPNSLN